MTNEPELTPRWIGVIQRRKLGLTKQQVQAELVELHRAGQVEGQAVDVLALTVLARLRKKNPAAFCEAEKAGADWEAILEFMVQLIEMLLPLILK